MNIKVKQTVAYRNHTEYLKLKHFYDHTDKVSQDPDDIKHRKTVQENVQWAIKLLKDASLEDNVNRKCRSGDVTAAYKYFYKKIVKILEKVCGTAARKGRKAEGWWTNEYDDLAAVHRSLGHRLRKKSTNRSSPTWKNYLKKAKQLKHMRRKLVRKYTKN